MEEHVQDCIMERQRGSAEQSALARDDPRHFTHWVLITSSSSQANSLLIQSLSMRCDLDMLQSLSLIPILGLASLSSLQCGCLQLLQPLLLPSSPWEKDSPASQQTINYPSQKLTLTCGFFNWVMPIICLHSGLLCCWETYEEKGWLALLVAH